MSNTRNVNLDTPEVREFWKSVFLTVLRLPAETYAAALNSADQAVVDMMARIPTKD